MHMADDTTITMTRPKRCGRGAFSLVEGDEVNQALAHAIVTRLGYSTDTAATGCPLTLPTFAPPSIVGDAAAVGHLAHRLHGASAILGVKALIGLCQELQVLAHAGALTPARDLVRPLEEESDRVGSGPDAVVPEAMR
jgi:hypothetical protein